jgi:hypothetical protein
MKKYFPLDTNHRTELYSALAKTIKHFYPVGVSTVVSEYHEYPGIKELGDITEDNIGNNKNYRKRWTSFLNKLRKELGKEINGTTYGFVPGFSGDLIIERYEDEVLIRIKRMAFAVSLIGPFYSICGIDETMIKEDDAKFPRFYHSINVVTASPYKEFENDFNCVQYWINKSFTGYKLVPLNVCMMCLKDIETPNSIGQEGTVYSALFNHLFNFYTHYESRGDGYYGAEKDPNFKITLAPPPPLSPGE